MALNQPYFTRVTELHEESRTPTIEFFINKNAKEFYETTASHDNPFIKPLGDYSPETLPFRIKHRLPRAV